MSDEQPEKLEFHRPNVEIFGLTPDQVKIHRGEILVYILTHPDERPEGPGWVLQRRAEGQFALWRNHGIKALKR